MPRSPDRRTLRLEHRFRAYLAIAGIALAAALILAAVAWGQTFTPPASTPLTAWLLARGIHGTEWRNGCVVTGDPRDTLRSTWHPDALEFNGRYGLTAEQRGCFFGYTGSTAGGHGDLVEHAQQAMLRLGIPYVYPLDAFDLSMVSGATAALIAASPGESPPPPSPTPVPTATPVPPPPPCACCQPGGECRPAGCLPPLQGPIPGPCASPPPAPTPTPPVVTPPCPPPAACPPAPRCVRSQLSARAEQTLRVAPSWTLVEQRKAWLRQLAAEVTGLRCEAKP